jgi:hypothetical protein
LEHNSHKRQQGHWLHVCTNPSATQPNALLCWQLHKDQALHQAPKHAEATFSVQVSGNMSEDRSEHKQLKRSTSALVAQLIRCTIQRGCADRSNRKNRLKVDPPMQAAATDIPEDLQVVVKHLEGQWKVGGPFWWGWPRAAAQASTARCVI